MSADNWAECPRCRAMRLVEIEKRRLNLLKIYGKVPPEQYVTEMTDLNNFRDSHLDETLREDYELGITPQGRFYVSYGGGCDKCGLAFTFKHEEAVDLSKVKKK